MATRLAAILAALLVAACAPVWAPLPPAQDVAEPRALLDEAETLVFRQRIHAFYQRLVQRRFNTLETFNDVVLRAHFRNPESFFDYYANLAESFSAAHFEKSRPVSVAIHEFVFDDPDRVRVQIEFVGEDDRPLRPNKVVLIRQDRWEQSAGNWWVAPGKL